MNNCHLISLNSGFCLNSYEFKPFNISPGAHPFEKIGFIFDVYYSSLRIIINKKHSFDSKTFFRILEDYNKNLNDLPGENTIIINNWNSFLDYIISKDMPIQDNIEKFVNMFKNSNVIAIFYIFPEVETKIILKTTSELPNWININMTSRKHTGRMFFELTVGSILGNLKQAVTTNREKIINSEIKRQLFAEFLYNVYNSKIKNSYLISNEMIDLITTLRLITEDNKSRSLYKKILVKSNAF